MLVKHNFKIFQIKFLRLNHPFPSIGFLHLPWLPGIFWPTRQKPYPKKHAATTINQNLQSDRCPPLGCQDIGNPEFFINGEPYQLRLMSTPLVNSNPLKKGGSVLPRKMKPIEIQPKMGIPPQRPNKNLSVYSFGSNTRHSQNIIWVFPKIGVPQNGWFIMENPIKMDVLGGPTPYFWKHPYHVSPHPNYQHNPWHQMGSTQGGSRLDGAQACSFRRC